MNKRKPTRGLPMEDYIAARGVPFKEELEKVLDFYGSDFDPDLLET